MRDTEPPVIDYPRGHSDLLRDGWIRLHWEGERPTLRFPFICANCLIATERRYRISVGKYNSISIGLCEHCELDWERRKQRFLKRVALIGFTAGAMVSIALAYSLERYWMECFSVGCFVFLVTTFTSILFSHRRAGPVQLRGSVFRTLIRFRNQRYTAIVLGLDSSVG